MRGAVACALILAMVAAPLRAAACWEADEYEAARMRDLQTVLMVSALKCGRAMPDMPGAYNRWVGRAKGDLISGEKRLLAHFVREGDKAKYDRFTTALANRYSQYAEDSGFCARARALLEADEKQPGVLANVALLINSKPNGVEEICPSKPPAGSQIIVSPFDPIPDARAPVAAASADPVVPVAGADAAPASATIPSATPASATPISAITPQEAASPPAAAPVPAPPAG